MENMTNSTFAQEVQTSTKGQKAAAVAGTAIYAVKGTVKWGLIGLGALVVYAAVQNHHINKKESEV